MPKDTPEPQSYGSEKDWVTGETGGNIHSPKSTPAPENAEFYDDERESEASTRHQGGKNSPVQLAENVGTAGARGEAETADAAAPRVTTEEGGARRDSFFKKRDYE